MEIRKKAWECRESFITTLIEEAEGKNKTIIKEIKKKREEMSNQWRIWNVVSGNKISAAITAVEITSNGNKVKVNNREEVEREIMKCLPRRFSLTNNNSTMEKKFTSKVGYLAEKEGAEDILNGNIQMIFQDDKEIKEFLEMLAIPKIKRYISSKIKTEDFKYYWEKSQ